MCNVEENLFSTLILGSVFNDYVVFYGDNLKHCNYRLAEPHRAYVAFYSGGRGVFQLSPKPE